jgi:hypothetical protein
MTSGMASPLGRGYRSRREPAPHPGWGGQRFPKEGYPSQEVKGEDKVVSIKQQIYIKEKQG